MHTGGLKKWALALTFWIALHTAPLRAQLLGPYGTSPITFGVDANGLLSATGTYGTGSLSLSGSGTRMFWYPGKAAFRAGGVTSTYWNDANIGQYSVAFGYNTTASGVYSTAFGNGATASSSGSTAFGTGTTASGSRSTAFGWGTWASGYYSTAFGLNTTASGGNSMAFGGGTSASGWSSTAFGHWSTASGTYATAFGYSTTAPGESSMAFGQGTAASGGVSTAFGRLTTASGVYSTASGYETIAQAYGDFVIGRFNLGTVSTGGGTSWMAADPLFEIGNGATYTSLSDALVVYKNGNAAFQGVVNVAAGGDIPMFTGY